MTRELYLYFLRVLMFTKQDFKIDSVGDLITFAPIFIFIAFVAPFVIGAYSLGFVMDKVGWLD